jgi:hypothetical protein
LPHASSPRAKYRQFCHGLLGLFGTQSSTVTKLGIH